MVACVKESRRRALKIHSVHARPGAELLEWSEAQRQVEAASGKVLQSHNESHAFRRYSPTPDAAAFGPPAGVACE